MATPKNKFIYALLTALALQGLCSCSESEPKAFDDLSGIYFNNRSASQTLQDSISVTFVYENADLLEIPVRIQLLGRPMTEERPVEITVSSDNATPGIDYEVPAQAALAGGATTLDYVVTLKRTPALKQKTKSLSFDIRPNSHFTLPVTYELQVGGDTVSLVHFEIHFSDMFTTPPASWRNDLLGPFAQGKFELICRVTGIQPADFNDPLKLTLALQLYINQEMNLYIAKETEKQRNGLPFDTDIIDPATGEPWNFG